MEVPYTDDLFWLSVDFGRQPQRKLLLDTGSNKTIIPAEWAKSLKLVPYAQVKSYSFFGESVLGLALAREVSIGHLKVPSPIIAYPSREEVKKTPVLGLNVLSRYRVLMDFPHRKLYLEPRVAATVAPTGEDVSTAGWRRGRSARSTGEGADARSR